MVARALGYKTVIVIPETQSQEKKDALRLLGAELVEVPAAPYRNPNNYVRLSGRLAEQIAASDPNGAIWANQFDNVANRQAHVKTTAPEIWRDTDGTVDGFICAVGSGGTLAGVAEGLRSQSVKSVKIGLADPDGAALYNFYTTGEMKSRAARSPKASARAASPPISRVSLRTCRFNIPDDEAIPLVFDLLEHEGLCLGGSSGINIAGAIRMAREMGPGHTIVTILCDYGNRYQSKLFNPEFLASKDLPVPEWLTRKSDLSIPYASEQ
jgi:cysteine synthase A